MATDVFHRTAYAEQMAQQLLQPSPLQMNVRSGVLLSGIRRGKTTFLRQDLVPALKRAVRWWWVDLWADRSKSPGVLDAVRHAAADADPRLGPAAALQRTEPGAVGLTLASRSNTWARPAAPRWRRRFQNWGQSQGGWC